MGHSLKMQQGRFRLEVGHEEEFLQGVGCQALEWVAQVGGGVTILEGVQETSVLGT